MPSSIGGHTQDLSNADQAELAALAAAAPRSAYTQTNSTADKTIANPTAATLTDNTTGTADTTLEALTSGTVYATDVAAIRNNFADLAAQINKLIVDQADIRAGLNAVIDDGQALGFWG